MARPTPFTSSCCSPTGGSVRRLSPRRTRQPERAAALACKPWREGATCLVSSHARRGRRDHALFCIHVPGFAGRDVARGLREQPPRDATIGSRSPPERTAHKHVQPTGSAIRLLRDAGHPLPTHVSAKSRTTPLGGMCESLFSPGCPRPTEPSERLPR